MRIASHGQPGLRFATVKDEVMLRQTTGGRYEIKATFLEDDRSIRTLTIQRYNKAGPQERQHFSFVGNEIESIINFIAGVKTVPLDDAAKVHLPDEVLREIILDQSQARRIFEKNSDLFLELAQQEDMTRDLVAVGYRRKQLKHFEALLQDEKFFAGPEDTGRPVKPG
jgi:hypothetical protein